MKTAIPTVDNAKARRAFRNVRSYYFRGIHAKITDPASLTLEDYRSFHRCAHIKALDWHARRYA